MRSAWLLLAFVGTTAFADSDEILIEQLMQRSAAVVKTPPQRRPAKTDPALALVGQPVRVRTVDRGLYLGKLTAVDAAAIHLDIATSSGQMLGYALPRSAVAQLELAAAP